MKQVLYNKKLNSYFLFVSEGELDIKCVVCERTFKLSRNVIVHKSFSKKEYSINYYCSDCIKKHNKGVYDIYLICVLTNEIPENSKVVPDTSFSISDGIISTFEASFLESEHTIDRTRYAGKESWGGARIGTKIESENLKLEEKDARKLLEGMK